MKLYTSVFLFIISYLSVLIAQNERVNKYLQQALPIVWEDNDSTFQQTLPVDDSWWKSFDDRILDSLINISVKQNYSALMALNRIDIAKATLRSEQGSYYPTLTLDAGWNKEQSSGNITSVPTARNHYFNTSINTNWEIDVFGRIRKQVKAEEENLHVSNEDYNATMVSLCAEVASAYINLREQQEELSVLYKNCDSQKAILKITQVRYETGLASKLDVAQAKSVYYNTKASIPSVEAGIIQNINSLSVLLGIYPQELTPIVQEAKNLPNYIEPIGVGIPSNLLRRRPDIRAAERQINAKAALLGVSKANWMPKFSINASVGYSAKDLDNLVNSNSLTYQIVPTVSINLFQGTKLINATKIAKYELEESINEFNQTVLTAVQEADNAMNSYRNSIKQIVALREVINYGQETLDLSLELYKQGLSPFQNVLDAQRSLLSYQNSLVQAKGNSLLYLIQMYKALGGGWNK